MFEEKDIHIMLDLETLATTMDAAVTEVGAIAFRFDKNKINGYEILKTFYSGISLDSNIQHRRKISKSTLSWWLRSDLSVQQLRNNLNTSENTLEFFVDSFKNNFIKRIIKKENPSNIFLWAHEGFDIAVIKYIYESFGLEMPIPHYNFRGLRSVTSLANLNDEEYNVLKETFFKKKDLQEHSSLGDCAWQIEFLYKCLKKIHII